MDPHPYRAASPADDAETGGLPPPGNVRIACVMLLLNAACVVAERVVAPAAAHLPGTPVAAVFDLLIAATLLKNANNLRAYDGLRKFAVFRAVVGGLLGVAIALGQKNHWQVGFQLLLSASLVYLLASRGRRALTALAVLGFAAYLGVELVGLHALTTGSNVLASARARLSDDFARPPPAVVTGARGHYRLPLPDGWQLYRDEPARRLNALADRWVVWPEFDANVLVISETLGAQQVIDVDRVLDGMVANIRAHNDGVRELHRARTPGGDRFVELAGTLREPRTELRYVLLVKVNGPEVIQLSAFHPAAAQARAHDGVMAMLQRVELTPIEAPPFTAAPGEPPPMTLVGPGVLQGQRAPYRFDLPTRAYLLDDALARASNPDIDRQLVFSFENVQLFVIAERLSAPGLTLDAFEAAALVARRQALPDLQIDAREAYPGRDDGRLIRFHATLEGRETTFLLGLVVRGDTALQVTAVCPTALSARHLPTLLETMRSLVVTAREPGGEAP